MVKKFWQDGKCHMCKMHTLAKCDGCSRFVCETHSKIVRQGNFTLDICNGCFKGTKPGNIVGGVKLSKKALDMA